MESILSLLLFACPGVQSGTQSTQPPEPNRLGAIGSLDQLGDGHDRQADLDPTWTARNCLKICRTVCPSALGRNDDAGVEDYSHVGGFHSLRFWRISSKSESRTGAFPVSSSRVVF
jgi:hypothetical protein